MHTTSHLLIGKTIYNLILEGIDFELNANSLKWGCIQPDYSVKLSNISHYKSESFNIISNMIISIQMSKFPNTEKELKYFSSQLGIILHYIADYFCYPHNYKSADKIASHFLYEIALDVELRKYLSNSFSFNNLNLTVEDYVNLDKSLFHYIEGKHNQYLKAKPSTSNDVYYILQVCCIVALNIITSGIAKSYPKSA